MALRGSRAQRAYSKHCLVILGLGLLFGLYIRPVHSQTAAYFDTPGLEPETREAVVGVGRALLLAKRSYVPDPAVTALRNDIDQIRQLLAVLAQPLDGAEIQLQSVNTPAPSPPAWQQVRAAEINQLRSAAANLRSQVETFLDDRDGADVSPSFLESVVSFFTGEESRPRVRGAGAQVAAPVTRAALLRLEQLDTEIETALSLPADERLQRLRELADVLRFDAERIHTADKVVTPTMSTRTQHRRSW